MTSHLCLPLKKYSIKGARRPQKDELPILLQPKFNVCMFFVVPLYTKNPNFRSLGMEGTRNEIWTTDIRTCSSGLVLTMCLSLFLRSGLVLPQESGRHCSDSGPQTSAPHRDREEARVEATQVIWRATSRQLRSRTG